MCTMSEEDCNNPENIQNGFVIDRTLESIEAIALAHMDEDGNIQTRTGDYKVRQGVTKFPITNAPEVAECISFCHSKFNTFNWVVNKLTV